MSTQSGEMGWQGHAPISVVATPQERAVQTRLRETIKGQTIENVIYGSGKLVLMLGNGFAFQINARDGFTLEEA